MKDEVVLITGAASGIGKATALLLAKAGAKIVAADINEASVEAVLAELGDVPKLGVRVDVRDEASVQAMVDKTVETFGRIDALVHSAGILRAKDSGPKMLHDLTKQECDDVIDINLKGTFLVDRAVVTQMIAQKAGRIINIASTSGRTARALDSVYCASKFGVVGLTESLAMEVAKHNVKVLLLLPDAIQTPLWDQNGPIAAPDFSLPPERVASLIEYMLKLPPDTVLQNVVIAPFRGRRRRSSSPPS